MDKNRLLKCLWELGFQTHQIQGYGLLVTFEGTNIVYTPQEDDKEMYKMVAPYVVEVKDEKVRPFILDVINQVNLKIKYAKAALTADNVFITFEHHIFPKENLFQLVKYSLELIHTAVNLFRRLLNGILRAFLTNDQNRAYSSFDRQDGQISKEDFWTKQVGHLADVNPKCVEMASKTLIDSPGYDEYKINMDGEKCSPGKSTFIVVEKESTVHDENQKTMEGGRRFSGRSTLKMEEDESQLIKELQKAILELLRSSGKDLATEEYRSHMVGAQTLIEEGDQALIEEVDQDSVKERNQPLIEGPDQCSIEEGWHRAELKCPMSEDDNPQRKIQTLEEEKAHRLRDSD